LNCEFAGRISAASPQFAAPDPIGNRSENRAVTGDAFLKAGVLSEEGLNRETTTGTPQGGILSPLLANIALSVLDEHFASKWEALGPEWTRAKRRRAGHPVMKLVRYADHFVIMVHGTRDDAEALWAEVGSVLAPMGLRLSENEDEGLPYRRGVRLPRVAHPAPTLARSSRQARDLHLPVQEGACLRGRQGADAHPPQETSNAR